MAILGTSSPFAAILIGQSDNNAAALTLGVADGPSIKLGLTGVITRAVGNTATSATLTATAQVTLLAAVNEDDNAASFYAGSLGNEANTTSSPVSVGTIDGAFDLGSGYVGDALPIIAGNALAWDHIYILSFPNGIPGDMPLGLNWMNKNPDGGIYPGWKDRT